MHLKNTIHVLDESLAGMCLPLAREQGTILSFLIHGLFESNEEAHCGLLDPQQGFTVAMLREFLGHFMRAGYRFVSPHDLTRRLCQQGKYVLLTFDDGYYNNIRALPALEEFGVPAVFFISSDNVKYGKGFWWDAVYRECRKRGRPQEEFRRMVAGFKQLRASQIESELRGRFGKSALAPVSDLDRPFTASELKQFAIHRLVFLGNHTRDHAILTNYSSAGIRVQIGGGQEGIREMTGKTPVIIAYPNGNCSGEIMAAAREAGLQFGLLACAGRNCLPLQIATDQALTMKRFTLWGDRSVEAQCRASRFPLSLYQLLYSMKKEQASAQPTANSGKKAKTFARSAGS